MKNKIFTSMFLTSGWQPPRRSRGGWRFMLPFHLRTFPLILILFFTFHFSLLTCSHAGYADGNGSPNDPFQIAEPNQLIYMSQHPEHWSQHFLLTTDINMNLADPNTFTTALIAPDTDNTNNYFDGIQFEGIYDGNGQTISNLTINGSGADNDYLGLFGKCSGYDTEVKNLGLKNVTITGGDESIFHGGLCGDNYFGSISNCYYLDTVGPHNGPGTALTDNEMKQQSSFVGWDFVGEEDNGTEDHWQMCLDGYDYPRLRWQFINPTDFLRPGRVDHYDLMVLAHDWLSVNSRCGDIGPGDGDGIVNLFDYIEFSRDWLIE
jgi:hypothetical protein